MVIDDSETNNLLIKSIFEEKGGYRIFTERSGVKALDYVERYQPDLILLDIIMPRKDGITVLKELKSNPGTKDIPVVVVSARIDQALIEKLMDLGASDYIRKPIGLNHLYDRIENFLSCC